MTQCGEIYNIEYYYETCYFPLLRNSKEKLISENECIFIISLVSHILSLFVRYNIYLKAYLPQVLKLCVLQNGVLLYSIGYLLVTHIL